MTVCGWRAAAAGRTRGIDDSDVIFAFADFKFGNAALADKINQRFEFSQIHGLIPVVKNECRFSRTVSRQMPKMH